MVGEGGGAYIWRGLFSELYGVPVPQQFTSMSSSHARESKEVLDSGFHGVDSGFQVLNRSLCQGNVDSGL